MNFDLPNPRPDLSVYRWNPERNDWVNSAGEVLRLTPSSDGSIEFYMHNRRGGTIGNIAAIAKARIST